jgi:lipopolysaccharide/colanic/teichoic acid biosynthesis glycosyltransferase
MLNHVAARSPLPQSAGNTAVIRPVAGRFTLTRARERRLLVAGLLGVDFLALVFAVVVAGAVRVFGDGLLPVSALGYQERHVLASVLVVPILVVLYWVQGRYEVQNCLIGPREYAQIAHATTYGVILAVALSYFAGGEPLVSRSWLLLVWLLSIIFVTSGRFLSRHAVRRLRRRGLLRTSVVIVGASTVGVALAEQFRAAEGEGIDVLGFLDEYLPVGQALLPGLVVLGRPADLVTHERNAGVDEYILVPQALPHERLEEITRLMIAQHGPVLRLAVTSSSLLTHGVLVTQRSSVPLITLCRARIGGLDTVLKRGLDIVGALAGLLVLGPLTLVAVVGALRHARHRLVERHRICTVGGALTAFCLLDGSVTDSLLVRGSPALLAVLRGHMSLVGPRPAPYMPVDLAHALTLAAIKPGLTGPWRLSGPHASREIQSLQDLSYVRNYSIWEDLRLLWLSARRVLVPQRPDDDLVRWSDDPMPWSQGARA